MPDGYGNMESTYFFPRSPPSLLGRSLELKKSAFSKHTQKENQEIRKYRIVYKIFQSLTYSWSRKTQKTHEKTQIHEKVL